MTNGSEWMQPAAVPPLGDEEAHLWRVDLAVVDADDTILDDDERSRTARLVKEEHRRRYAAAQTTLRRMLSAYTDIPAGEIAFRRGPHGKPYLIGSDLQFNITHSDDVLLAVFAWRMEVGVDVERIRPERPVMSLARRYYTEAEREWLGSLPEAERAPAFFRLWTLKEAFLKARSTGLSGGLNTFDYDIAGMGAPRLVRANAAHGDVSHWQSAEIAAHPDYAAALVTAGPRELLRTFTWPPSDLPSP